MKTKTVCLKEWEFNPLQHTSSTIPAKAGNTSNLMCGTSSSCSMQCSSDLFDFKVLKFIEQKQSQQATPNE
jgi:hypothetical protein